MLNCVVCTNFVVDIVAIACRSEYFSDGEKNSATEVSLVHENN